MDDLDPMKTFASASGLGSLAGLAYLLRSGKELTRTAIASAMINSGLTSLAIAFLWFNYYREQNNTYFLLGICTLAGLGGASVTDLLVTLFKKNINNDQK